MALGQDFGDGAGKHPSKQAASAARDWLRRQIRGLWPDRNPLRRRSDRVESYLLAGLFVAAAAGAPFAAQAASHAAYDSARTVQQAQKATRYPVSATLTQRAGATIDGYSLSAEVPAKATWTSVNGKQQSGEVLARVGSATGTKVRIWTDANGHLSSPPLAESQISGQANAAAVGAAVGVVVVFLAGAGATRAVFYRRRLAAWETDWRITARTWNRQSW